MSKKNKTTNQYRVRANDDRETELTVGATSPEEAIRAFLQETNYDLDLGDEFEVDLITHMGTYRGTLPPPTVVKLTKNS